MKKRNNALVTMVVLAFLLVTPEKQMPDFLDTIDERALNKVKPAVVNIIR